MKYLLLILLAAVSGYSSADRIIESKKATKSPYYKGELKGHKVSYVSLSEWLEVLSKKGQDKDVLDVGFLLDEKALVQPLYDMANKLLQGWPGTAPEFPIFVKMDGSASAYGAEVLSNNEMLIYHGTLINVTSDDELAAVIAHELGHLLLNHHRKHSRVKMAKALFHNYEDLKVMKETLGAVRLNKAGDDYQVTLNDSMYGGIVRAGEQRERASRFHNYFHRSSFGRGAEIEADLLAVDLLIKAGYSATGLKHAMERLSSSFTLEQKISNTLLNSVQGLMNDTQKLIEGEVASFVEDGSISNPQGDFLNLVSNAGDALKGQLFDNAIEYIDSTHPVPKKRLEKFAKYMSENYTRKHRRRRPVDKMVSRYKRLSEYRIFEKYQLAERSSEYAMLGDTGMAVKEALQSLSGIAKSDPYVRYLAYTLRKNQGMQDKSIANIKLIKSFQYVPNSIISEFSQTLAKGKQDTLAKKLIAEREGHVGTMEEFYPAKIQIALNQDDMEKAKLLVNECLDRAKRMEFISQQCRDFNLLDATDKKEREGFFGRLKSMVPGSGSKSDK